jgi:hypothetical protein
MVPFKGDAAQNVSFELNPDWVGIEDGWLDLAPACEEELEAIPANETTTTTTVAISRPTFTTRRIPTDDT